MMMSTAGEVLKWRERIRGLIYGDRSQEAQSDRHWWSFRLDATNPAALALTTLLFAIALVPWIPLIPMPSLDSSWATAHNLGFQQGWQWGKDIVFTHGPWGWLIAPQYHPSTYTLLVTVWAGISFVLAQTLLYLRRGSSFGFWTSTTLIFLVLTSATYPGARLYSVATATLFMTLPIFCVLVQLRPSERGFWAVNAGLIAVMALSGSIQFLYLVLSVSSLLLLDCYRLLARRSFPVLLLLWAAFFLFFRWCGGQQLRSLPAFFHFSFEVTTGFSDAMSLVGPGWEVIAFAAVALSTLAFVAIREFQQWKESASRDPWSGILVILVWGLGCFLVFKSGFVRHDGHAVRAWSWLFMAALLYGFRFQPNSHQHRFRVAFPILMVLLAISWVHQVGVWFGHPPVKPATDFAMKFHPNNLAAIAGIVVGGGRDGLFQRQNEAIANVLWMGSLPPLPGTVDIFPWDEVVPIARGLDYRPLPVFQSYIVYTSDLIDLNRTRLISEDAPTFLALRWEGLDGRWPTLGMGNTIVDAITLYKPRGSFGRYVILQRRDSPARLVVDGTDRFNVQLNEWVPIRPEKFPLMASFSIHKTLLGTVVGMLFKLPELEMDVRFENGTVGTYRMIPKMAETGFLLSPLPETPIDSAALFTCELADHGRRVAAIRLRDTGPAGYFRHRNLSVTLEELTGFRSEGGEAQVSAGFVADLATQS